MEKSAKQWDKFCKAYAKYPQRAMKEKGHSKTSEILTRLHIKKNTGIEKPQNSATGNAPPAASKKDEALEKLRLLKTKLTSKDKKEPKTAESGNVSVVSST